MHVDVQRSQYLPAGTSSVLLDLRARAYAEPAASIPAPVLVVHAGDERHVVAPAGRATGPFAASPDGETFSIRYLLPVEVARAVSRFELEVPAPRPAPPVRRAPVAEASPAPTSASAPAPSTPRPDAPSPAPTPAPSNAHITAALAQLQGAIDDLAAIQRDIPLLEQRLARLRTPSGST